MRFEDWEPHYTDILKLFGFDRADDERAALLLSELVAGDSLPLLESLCRGKDVTVCGNAPCLKDELDRISGVLFAADAAADLLFRKGIRPDVVFTDLKKNQILWENNSLMLSERYSLSDENSQFKSEEDAQEEIANKLFDTIMKNTLEEW